MNNLMYLYKMQSPMKFAKYFTMIAIAMALTSCGGSDDE